MATVRQAEADLAVAAHIGDAAAATELRGRHAHAGHRLAVCCGDDRPDELVDRAFTQLIDGVDAVPVAEGTFRARLFVAVGHLASTGATASGTGRTDDALPVGIRLDEPLTIGAAESTAVLSAFADVPDRLQITLWMTEVDDRSPGQLAPVLGMTPNAVTALVDRAHDALRQAYLHRRAGVARRPGCRPHRARLAAYGHDDGADRTRTATMGHLEGCPSCRALALELSDVTRLFRRALVPFFALPDVGADAADTPAAVRSLRSSAAAVVGVQQFGRRAVSAARRDLRVVAAAGASCLLLAAAIGITGLRSGAPGAPRESATPAVADTAAGDGASRPPDVRASVATTAGDVSGPTGQGPDAGGPTPPTTPPVAAVSASSSSGLPASPGVAEAVAPSPPAPGPPPPAPRPPATTSLPATPSLDALAVPDVGSVTWLPSVSQVQISLVNRTDEPTGFLVLNLATLGGALVGGQPTGCALGLGFGATAMCALSSLGPGANAVVRVPVMTTGPGQSARVTLCSAAGLALDCESSLLPPTSIALD